mgnify:CR=1 FL=1
MSYYRAIGNGPYYWTREYWFQSFHVIERHHYNTYKEAVKGVEAYD